MANKKARARQLKEVETKPKGSKVDRLQSKMAKLEHEFDAIVHGALAAGGGQKENAALKAALEKAAPVRDDYIASWLDLCTIVICRPTIVTGIPTALDWVRIFIPRVYPCTRLSLDIDVAEFRNYAAAGTVRSTVVSGSKEAFAGAGTASLGAPSHNRMVVGFHTEFRVPCAPTTLTITSRPSVTGGWIEAISFGAATAHVVTNVSLEVQVGNQTYVQSQSQGTWADAQPNEIDHPPAGETRSATLSIDVTIDSPDTLVIVDEKFTVTADRFGLPGISESTGDFNIIWAPLQADFCCP